MKKILLIGILVFVPQFAFAGSQTFTSSGTFTVPAYSTLTVTVNGAGGGSGSGGATADAYDEACDSGADGFPGTAGESSSFNGTVIGYGGAGGAGGEGTFFIGYYDPGSCFRPAKSAGASGSAGGGDSNTVGGGAAGAVGGAGGYAAWGGFWIAESGGDGGAGGAGGRASRIYSSGQLSTGSSIPVVVGRAGSGGVPSGNPALAGHYTWRGCNEGWGNGWGYTCVQSADGSSGTDGSVTITWTDPVNEAPTTPAISGPTSGSTKTSYTYTFTSTDPDSDTIRYGIDWDDDDDVDEYAPALGYVSSGTAGSTTHSWNSSNTQTFKVLAQDSEGATSGWASYSVNMSPNAPTVLLTATPDEIESGESVTLQWSSSNANSCTGTNFSTGGATAGTATVSPTATTVYSVTCAGQGNQDTADAATVTHTCTPVNQCSGNNVVNSCTGAVVQSCSYQCGAGACISPPPPSFNPDAEADTTGHLHLRPSLLPVGGRTSVFWDVSNVESCTVLGDNMPPPADTWTILGTAQNNWTSTSGATGLLSAPIVQRTTYTLSCTPLEGQTFTQETAVVNVVPVFLEL